MPKLLGNNHKHRRSFATARSVVEPGDLLEVQTRSYERFLQRDRDPLQREEVGLQAAFLRVFPVDDFSKRASLRFVRYDFGTPKHDPAACRARGLTYQAPLRITVRLVVWDADADSGQRTQARAVEQEVGFGSIPLMTDDGTFIVGGVERVVVGQLQRSPGIVFEAHQSRTGRSQKSIFSARISPARGALIDFEFDHRDLLYVRIDRRRKLPATVLLRALGYSAQELLEQFYDRERVASEAEVAGRIAVCDVVDPESGETLVECNEEIDDDHLDTLRERGVEALDVLVVDDAGAGDFLRDTLRMDSIESPEEAVVEIYCRLKPGEPPSPDEAKRYLEKLLFDPEHYDLSPAGRFQINHKLGLALPLEQSVLTPEDLLRVVAYLIGLQSGRGRVDDLAHLGNRRVRTTGELLEQLARTGLVRMAKAIKERMRLSEFGELLPRDLVSAKPFRAAVEDFLRSSQLCQYLQQTNPLAELTHKRRLTPLGQGGLTRERAGGDLRDVHPSHYGRICPIETPEGPDFGLVASLPLLARIDGLGFIEAPYRRVDNGRITDDVAFFSALLEDGHVLTASAVATDEDGALLEDVVEVREWGRRTTADKADVTLMDVAPQQMVSVAASLIPFLEHDDPHRALMGCNMQRQAVPVIRAEAPLVGTGMERVVAHQAGATTACRRAGTVEAVDASRIVIRCAQDDNGDSGPDVDVYDLVKFRRSNQSTCINQKPLVRPDDVVEAGELLTDGSASDRGELALGQNVVVAFMPWGGHNFAESILVSERLVRDDLFTSIHIEEFELTARDSRFGPEEITRDLPGLGDWALTLLDDTGVVKEGIEVRPGDVLVGKVTPVRGGAPEVEQRRDGFEQQNVRVKDTSLRVPAGVSGIVIGARIFEGEDEDRDSGRKSKVGVLRTVKVHVAVKRKLQAGDKLCDRHGTKGLVSRVLPMEDMPFLEDGRPVDLVLNPLGLPSHLNVGQLLEAHLGWASKGMGERIGELIDGAYPVELLRGYLLAWVCDDEASRSFVESASEAELTRFARKLEAGVPVSTPVFGGATEEEIKAALEAGGRARSGQEILFDGRTGEPFDADVTVGVAYLFKLHHLVVDKVQARSVGPYSLVTQQPLASKVQYGGQRIGEEEVWAMQAYGAAYNLREFLTVKSDDTAGRARMRASILRGEPILAPGLPESLSTLVKELQALALDPELLGGRDNSSAVPQNNTAVRLGLASPDKIRSWSSGEVLKPETIDHKTCVPLEDGLFCERIFGPAKDYECLCGNYKGMKHGGLTCEVCGAEVTQSRARRERMGHIELASPAAHIWFVKSLPSRIATLLELSTRELEGVLYGERYIVTHPGGTSLGKHACLDEEDYQHAVASFGLDAFEVGTGGGVIRELLAKLDLVALSDELRAEMRENSSDAQHRRSAKRLEIVEAFRSSGNRPEWMMLEVIPVIPPDLRPLVPLDRGRFATSDLNDLYRRVINRNNRLKRLLELNAPEIIIRNEKRMLQEAVDALFDNGRRGKIFTGPNKRPLRSLSDMIKGSQGRFRQGLLGKRVDHSGRSVIVPGPELSLHQCGLPKTMALELFRPFLYGELLRRGLAATVEAAKTMVDEEWDEVWDGLEEVSQRHPLLLNRRPTLHRLDVQAFEPVLVEGKAIRLHPLVCAAFQADFDGDQVVVHVPLSTQAQNEARVLMLSTHNMLDPAHGKPVIRPTREIVLGANYMTRAQKRAKGEGRVFCSPGEVIRAWDARVVDLHARITVRMPDEPSPAEAHGERVETTVGRVLLYQIVPRELPFSLVNKVLDKRALTELVHRCHRVAGAEKAARLADRLMELGFSMATQAGVSLCIDDLHVPSDKSKLLEEARDETRQLERRYQDGHITAGEKRDMALNHWVYTARRINKQFLEEIGAEADTSHDGRTDHRPGFHPIHLMVDSGVGASVNRVQQLGGMIGLVAEPSEEIGQTPIVANLREGLSASEYFCSTHRVRRRLARAERWRTNYGYMTRRLVDAAGDIVVASMDCGTTEGLVVTSLLEGGEVARQLGERILGRVAAEDVLDPPGDEPLARCGDLLDEEAVARIVQAGVDRVKLRSAAFCALRRGVCAACYGRDLATGDLVEVGEAVGVVAAQSIGKRTLPGSFWASRARSGLGSPAFRSSIESLHSGLLRYGEGLRTVTDRNGKLVVVGRRGAIAVMDEKGRERARHTVPYGATILVRDGQRVSSRERLAAWDPLVTPIIATTSGEVSCVDFELGSSVARTVDKKTGRSHLVVTVFWHTQLKPRIVLRGSGDGKLVGRHFLPVDARIVVRDGQAIQPGDVLASIPRELPPSRHVAVGLPRVAELFEARKPKVAAIVTAIDGVVSFGRDTKGKRRIIVAPEGGEPQEYLIPKDQYLTLREGDHVRAGDALMLGTVNPHDVFRILGEDAVARHLVDEVQLVYWRHGATIDDKHVELIVRQMLRRVEVGSPGDTEFRVGEVVGRHRFEETNRRIASQGGRPATAERLLQGISRASSSTDSFIAAASSQETTRVLTQAAIRGQVDPLRGHKENIVMGRLIPAGTGFVGHEDHGPGG